jgi:hypothetical protein
MSDKTVRLVIVVELSDMEQEKNIIFGLKNAEKSLQISKTEFGAKNQYGRVILKNLKCSSFRRTVMIGF